MNKIKEFLKKNGGKIFYWIVIAGFIYFLARQFEDLEKSGETLIKGNLWFIGLALLAQFLYYLFMAQMGKKFLQMVGVEYDIWKMFSIVVSQFFMSITIPGGIAGSMAYRVREIANDSKSQLGQVFVGLIMMTLAQYWAFLLLALGTVWFSLNSGFEYAAMTTAIFIFMIISGFVAGVFYLILEYPSKLLKLIYLVPFIKKYIVSAASKVKGLELSENWIEQKLFEINASARKFVSHKSAFMFLILSGLMLHIIQIAVLFMVFVAFGIPFDASLLVVVYTSLFLFSVVSLTPQGIGVVETAALVVFVAFGVARNESILVVTAYRAITVWIPILAGAVAFRLQAVKRRKRSLVKAA